MNLLKKFLHGTTVFFGTVLSLILVCFLGFIAVIVESILRLCDWIFEQKEKKRSRSSVYPIEDRTEK